MLRNIVRNSLKQQTRRQVLNTSTRALAPSISILNRVNSCTPAAPTQRQFNTSSIHWNKDSNENTKYTITELTMDRYHKLSDEILDFMCAKLEELADEIDMKGFDVEYNQGVMTISVGQHGTYVINKQPPNHQIWLSSPVSGPQRYDYDEQHGKWFYYRDNHTLDQVLNTELSKAIGEEINLLDGFEPEEK